MVCKSYPWVREVDQEKIKLTKRMLPFLMRPHVLIILMVTSILGEAMWIYLAIRNGNYWECIILFAVGFFLGFVGGGWTAKLWDKYYIQSLLKRVRIMKTTMGKRNSLFIFLALGVPMVLSFALASYDPFLPALQSYIFGFICGMNIALYLWARRLPD